MTEKKNLHVAETQDDLEEKEEMERAALLNPKVPCGKEEEWLGGEKKQGGWTVILAKRLFEASTIVKRSVYVKGRLFDNIILGSCPVQTGTSAFKKYCRIRLQNKAR